MIHHRPKRLRMSASAVCLLALSILGQFVTTPAFAAASEAVNAPAGNEAVAAGQSTTAQQQSSQQQQQQRTTETGSPAARSPSGTAAAAESF